MAKIQRHFLIDAPFRAGAARLRTLIDRVDKAFRARRRQRALWGLALLALLPVLAVAIIKPAGIGWPGSFSSAASSI